MKKCKGCGIELVYTRDDGLCGVCRADEQLRDSEVAKIKKELFEKSESKPELKVFRIIVYEQRMRHEWVTDTIIVLATSEDVATDLVFPATKPHTYMVKDTNYHIWEIEGPFKEGSILYRTPQ